MSTSTYLKKMRVGLCTSLDTEIIRHLTYIPHIYQEHSEKVAESLCEQVKNDYSLNYNEKSMEIDHIQDEVFNAGKAIELYNELSFIALYKTMEINIKNAAIYSDLFTQEQIKKFFKIDELIKEFKKIKIEIKKIEKYSSFNELRVLNNCIKHSGLVTKGLENIDSAYGKKGDTIKIPSNRFEQLLNDNMEFLSFFGCELKSKIN
ncbi:hypothetical protein [Proteus terrae]|uniref:hypothetical protein n=1 Tax=Proteus terrae TaxID=1574161 RepID=UPI00301C0D8D